MTDWPFGLLARHRYGVILADFPWRFQAHSGPSVPQRAVVQHYPTMSLQDGLALPVADLAANDCALIMWSTSSHLAHCMYMATKWGFTFKGKTFAWAKTNKLENEMDPLLPTAHDSRWFFGMGYGTRKNTEDAWLFTRGNPKRLNADVRELIVSPVRQHSRKPDVQYERIERLYGGPYCELFARTQRAGWSSWGNETEKF